MDLDVTDNELCEFINYMYVILHYPIPNKNCIIGDELQQDIILVMEKFMKQLLEKLGVIESFSAHSLLGASINKYLECALLIVGNQFFVKKQIEKTTNLAETIRFKVKQMSMNSSN